eukprot:scaffold106585_cov14-Prasinocladus_malaysianus.AAC.1
MNIRTRTNDRTKCKHATETLQAFIPAIRPMLNKQANEARHQSEPCFRDSKANNIDEFIEIAQPSFAALHARKSVQYTCS